MVLKQCSSFNNEDLIFNNEDMFAQQQNVIYLHKVLLNAPSDAPS